MPNPVGRPQIIYFRQNGKYVPKLNNNTHFIYICGFGQNYCTFNCALQADIYCDLLNLIK